jgi:transposase
MPRRERRSFTPEFKERTVELIESSCRSIRDVCRELDLTESAVRRWVEQAEIDRGRKEGVTSAEREELERLRRENRILKEEREILKKAAAFFASETR